MRGSPAVGLLFVVALFGGCIGGPDNPAPQAAVAPDSGADDVVVVAVIDSGFNPYHWDFLAAHMPQHLNDDATDDLPLGVDPASWMPGHPGAAAFESYQALNLTLTPDDPAAVPADLADDDDAEWSKVQRSAPDSVHMSWIPGTKIVGFVNFGSGTGFAASSHGVGTTSVSVGNIHGSCPECVLVFVQGTSEQANEWVEKQDWIDLQTNSWGLSLAVRDRLYAGSDTELQRTATERGQSIFFSAGNGQANAFLVPNPTLWSSQEGPDWIITVGAIDPQGRSYTGHGKPADIASLGTSYPSAGGSNVTADSTFGGTSNATPVTAGTYARALYLLRREMVGASRLQENGTVSVGGATCAAANPDCALSDGTLTVDELRNALFQSAEHTPEGWVPGPSGVELPYESTEMMYMAEGHGVFWGKMNEAWWEDAERVAGFANGTWFEEQEAEEREWFIADSFCRQSLWGSWEHGYAGADAEIPAADLAGHPLRTWLTDECPERGRLIHGIVEVVNGGS